MKTIAFFFLLSILPGILTHAQDTRFQIRDEFTTEHSEMGLPPSTTLVVTKTADTNDGVCNSDCSLREAVTAAASGDTIEFASPLFDTAQTVQVNGQVVINKNLTINGRGANLTTIQNIAAAGPTSRVFQVINGAAVNLSGLTITGGNLSTTGFTGGGGVYSNGTLTITNSVISGNSVTGDPNANRGGGIFFEGAGTLWIVNSLISGNSCAGNGGGIYIFNNTAFVINSTISGNSALLNQGGGINLNFGTLNIINSTVSNNFANTRAGGLNNDAGTLNALNTIVSNNSSPSLPDLRGSLSVASTNNLIGGNAGLLPLGNYGGTTPTHAILPTSPAVNGGNNCVLTQTCTGVNPPSPLTTDQRGKARVGQVDIGAFESPASLIVTNTNDSGAGSLRGAIAAANATADDEAISFDIPASDSGCANGVCTITLTSGQLAVNDAATSGTLTVANTTGAANLRVSGNNQSRVFHVNGGGNAILSGLTVTRGNAGTCGLQCYGGGVRNLGSLLITETIVTENSQTNTGAGIGNDSGVLTIVNSTISNNFTPTFVSTGGIINFRGTLNMTNSTISGNQSGDVGGLSNFQATANLTNVTIFGNVATNGATGGVRNNGTLNLFNSIIAGNTGVPTPDFSGTINSLGFNIIGNTAGANITGTTTGNILNQPALLAPLGFYGGATPTHALLSGSPAINNGTSTNAPAVDQRGAARVGQVDIGAFELNNSANGGNFRAKLPDGRVGSPYSFVLVPSNGTTTYAVTGGALPPGMNLTTALAPNAVVSLTGTPTSGGAFNFTITAIDGGNTNVTDYTLNIVVPTAAGVSVSGRVMTSEGRGLSNAVVVLTDASGESRNVRTGSFGYFRFEDIAAGQVVTVEVRSKRFTFAPQVVFVGDEVVNLEFVGNP